MPGLTVMIKPVSSACNMRCKYCFYTDVSRNREQSNMGRMTLQTLETIVRRALRYADGPVSFVFQGGEPTLAGPDFYRALLRFQKKYNSKGLLIQNSLQSNGYTINQELIDIFREGNFLLGISLDGTKAIHDLHRIDAHGNGSYDTVLATIRQLQENHIPFNILCVVNEFVAKAPEEVFHALAPYGYIQYIPCIDDFDGTTTNYSLTSESYSSFLKASFDLYYDSFKKGAPVSIRVFDNYVGMLLGRAPENCAMSGQCAQYYLIEADGSVYPCDFYVLDQWRMGNINDQSFFSLAKSPVAERFRSESLFISPQCRQCRWYQLCRGGCRRDREPFDAHLSLNKWCSCTKSLLDYSYDRMADMARHI